MKALRNLLKGGWYNLQFFRANLTDSFPCRKHVLMRKEIERQNSWGAIANSFLPNNKSGALDLHFHVAKAMILDVSITWLENQQHSHTNTQLLQSTLGWKRQWEDHRVDISMIWLPMINAQASSQRATPRKSHISSLINPNLWKSIGFPDSFYKKLPLFFKPSHDEVADLSFINMSLFLMCSLRPAPRVKAQWVGAKDEENTSCSLSDHCISPCYSFSISVFNGHKDSSHGNRQALSYLYIYIFRHSQNM